MDKKSLYALIRDEITKAAELEANNEPFNLFGRGHEPRVSLNRTMALVLRGCSIPRVTISGFGANNFYPKRIFVTAGAALSERLGRSPFEIYGEREVYLVDLEKLLRRL
jgi:hypothetical protein